MRATKVFCFTLAATVALGTQLASATSVTPEKVYGNKTCADLGYDKEIKFDGLDQLYAGQEYEQYGCKMTMAAGKQSFDWVCDRDIDAVLAKGGTDENKYGYDPEARYDKGLYAPINGGGQYPELSHVSFCYDLDLYVKKTAKTSMHRTWEWYIKKSADYDSLTLMVGQYAPVLKYMVDVYTAYKDSKWAVSGAIEISNPSGKNAKIISVTDVVSDGYEMTVHCPGTKLPDYAHTLYAGDTMVCTYEGYLPDGKYRTNTATVYSEYVDGGAATAPVDFQYAYVTKVDECVHVKDSYEYATGMPADVCAKDSPKKFYYDRHVAPYTEEHCDKDIVLYNKAEYTTKDTYKTGYSTVDIPVYLECDKGCTLTLGYWKNHSDKYGKKYDKTWDYLPYGSATVFYLSAKTWLEVFKTPVGGNPYYNLAHQYMAAKLNVLNGASSTAAVDAAMGYAEGHFEKYQPSYVVDKALKTKMLEWAKTLDQYNNGVYGPGHCSY